MAVMVVVEDECDIASLIATYLRREGHEVYIENAGVAGLATIRSVRPNLAVIDWMMPGLDGIQLATAVRSDPSLDEVSLMMVSARDSADDRKTAEDAGFDAIVTKPFRRLEIVRAANALI